MKEFDYYGKPQSEVSLQNFNQSTKLMRTVFSRLSDTKRIMPLTIDNEEVFALDREMKVVPSASRRRQGGLLGGATDFRDNNSPTKFSRRKKKHIRNNSHFMYREGAPSLRERASMRRRSHDGVSFDKQDIVVMQSNSFSRIEEREPSEPIQLFEDADEEEVDFNSRSEGVLNTDLA